MIKDLRNGMSADGTYLVKDCSCLTGSNGNSYFSLTLQDASGTIDAKKFDVYEKDEMILAPGNFIEIEGVVNVYREKMQIIVRYASKLDKNKVDYSHFIPSAPISQSVLEKDLKSFIESIKDEDCYKIVKTIFDRNYNEFIVHPAAVRNHHDFNNGLLYHTVTMCKLADHIASLYPNINRDILISGCLLHDIGKLKELSGAVGCHYTVEGNLLGHLVIGTMMVNEVANDLQITSEVPLLLEHMIASHHGKLEYGAAILPQTQEALLLSMIDDMDAKANSLNKNLSNIKEGTFTEKIFPLDNRSFYKPGK